MTMTRRLFLVALPAVAIVRATPSPDDSVRLVKDTIRSSIKIGAFSKGHLTFNIGGKAIAEAVETAIDRGHGRAVLRALESRL